METCCGYGYDPARKSNSLPWIFKGPRECTEPRRSRGVLREQRPYLRLNRFQGVRPSNRKENSARDPRRRIQVRLRYRARASEEAQSPRPGSGILTRFPFNQWGESRFVCDTAHFRKAFANVLGSTDPHTTAVHVEPFSTSVFKDLT